LNKILPNYVNNEIQIQVIGSWPFINDRKNILKRIGYHWNSQNKTWCKKIPSKDKKEIFFALKQEYLVLKSSFSVTEIDFESFKYSIKNEFEKKETSAEEKEFCLSNLPEHIQKVIMPHQIEGIRRFINQNNKILLAWEMGTGKSLGSLTIVQYFQKKSIIIVPKSLISQWKEQIIRWGIAKENEIYIYDQNSPILYNKRFYIFNYEKMRFLFSKDAESISKKERIIYDWILTLNPKEYVLIWDEMYKIKNYKSKLFKAHQKLRSSFLWFGIIGLTGTPLENSLLDFYTIINFIEPYCITWQQMEQYFMYRVNEFITVYRNLKKFNELASVIMHRVLMTDVRKDLPELIQSYRFVENSGEAHELAEVLKNTCENGILEIYTMLKCIDSYFCPTEELKKFNIVQGHVIEHTEKLNEVLDVLEEIGNNQILIFTQFARTAEWLKDKLIKEKYKCETVTGGTSSQRKDEIKADLISGKIQIVIATSVWTRGVDLPNINYLCNWDMPFTPSEYGQRIKRIFRLGSHESKVIINLVSDIIEDSVYNILKDKLSMCEIAVEGVEEKDIMNQLAKKWGIT